MGAAANFEIRGGLSERNGMRAVAKISLMQWEANRGAAAILPHCFLTRGLPRVVNGFN
jgi:hypothetical protein